MAWTTPKTWTSTTLTAAELNEQVRDNETWIKSALTTSGITSDSALSKVKSAACGVVARSTATQNISDSTDTLLTWATSEDYDTDGFHSLVSNQGRITIPSGLDGIYILNVSVRWDSNGTGDRWLWIEDDSAVMLARSIQRAATGTYTQANLTAIVSLAAADWVAAYVRQSSTSTIGIDKSAGGAHFSAHRLFAA